MILFHADNEAFFATPRLRAAARKTINENPLTLACLNGERACAIAMLEGFWPFVRDLEGAIDARLAAVPKQPLEAQFGRQKTRMTLTQIARELRDLASAKSALFTGLKEMKQAHAELWRQDARNIGARLEDSDPLPKIGALIDASLSTDLTEFFALLVTGEMMSEELALALSQHGSFTSLFSNGRWLWGEAHMIENETTHLDIRLDLMRAYSPGKYSTSLQNSILRGIAIFAAAAGEVFQRHRQLSAA